MEDRDVDEPSEILPKKLYLGGIHSASNEKKFKEYQISAILNCSPGVKNYFEKTLLYKNLDIQDDVKHKIEDLFKEAHEFINDNKVVLVHCLGGASRSVTIVISYLMKYKGMTLQESYQMLKEKRFIIRPNIGFMRQLLDYEVELYGKESLDFQDYISEFFATEFDIKKQDLIPHVKEIFKNYDGNPHHVSDQIIELARKLGWF